MSAPMLASGSPDECKVKTAIFDVMQQTLKVDINHVTLAEEKTVLSQLHIHNSYCDSLLLAERN